MTAPQKGEDQNWGELPQFRTLRRLITILTATLIIGIMTIAAVLIWRIASEPGPRVAANVTADQVTIPAGAEIIAAGATPAALTLAIRDGEGEALLVFHPETGALLSRTTISRER